MGIVPQKFKLSDASTIRQKFPLTARVKDLLEFIFEKELVLHNAISINNLSLVCVSKILLLLLFLSI